MTTRSNGSMGLTAWRDILGSITRTRPSEVTAEVVALTPRVDPELERLDKLRIEFGKLEKERHDIQTAMARLQADGDNLLQDNQARMAELGERINACMERMNAAMRQRGLQVMTIEDGT